MLKFGIESYRRIFYAGECVKIFLYSDEPLPDGIGYLRTNLGMAAIRRREIIDQVEKNQRPSGRDWQDILLRRIDDKRFEKELILTENGIFELKPFFVPIGKDCKEMVRPHRNQLRQKILLRAGTGNH